jgi:hypothetical protein
MITTNLTSLVLKIFHSYFISIDNTATLNHAKVTASHAKDLSAINAQLDIS